MSSDIRTDSSMGGLDDTKQQNSTMEKGNRSRLNERRNYKTPNKDREIKENYKDILNDNIKINK
jgi:hypothetical protein